jgi:glucosyl-3-phosphoglycerate phosphatase
MTQPVRRLILIRHGQTEWNVDGRMQGQLDTELTEVGRSQAKEAARELAARRPVVLVSSDLRRAWDSATILAENCAEPVVLRAEPRLRETSLGEWEGLDHTAVDQRYPGARMRWRFDATVAPPGGENRLDVAARAVPVVTELLAELPEWAERPVILVAHGGLIAALVGALLELAVESWPALGGLGNASWVELSAWSIPGSRGLRWRLDVWNASARVAPDVL